MKNISTKGHTTMKRFLLPMVIAAAALSAVGSLAQDAATRNLILRGTNTTVANVGTLTVTTLTAPRTYSLPDANGTILISPNATLSPNRILVTNNDGYAITQDMTTGSLIIGKTDGTYAVATPSGSRGLVVTLGDGTLNFALPASTNNAILRYDNTAAAWVPSVGSTLDGSGNFSITGNALVGGTLGVTGTTTLSSTLGVTGNTTIGGTLGVTGATTLSSTLGVTGNTTIGGTLGVTGATTLSSTLDVTGATTLNNSLTQVGTGQVTFGGNVDANNGLDVANADLTVGGTNFTVAPATGNTAIAGTLGVTGNVAVNTNKFTVTAASGNTAIAGTLGVTGDVAVNTNKFTVTAASGNTAIAGTLGVTGDVAVNTNKFTVTAASGNTGIGGTLTVDGNTTLGSGNADNVTINVDNGVNASGSLTINGLNTGSASDDVLMIDASTDVVKRQSFSSLIDGDNGVIYNEGGSGKMRLGGLNTTDVPFTNNRYINLNNRNLSFTTNNGGNTVLALTGGTGGNSIGVTINATSGGSIALNGTTNVTGTTGITGNTSITGTLGVSGDVAINTNKFTVAASTGNTAIAGTLNVTGDIAVNTNKFTVAAATGNTGVSGTLAVTDAATFNGNVTLGDANTDVVTAYLPSTGAASDQIVLANSNVLRKASVSTVIGTSAWMIGGNTFSGGGSTRRIGMSSTNGDGFAIMTENTDRLTITSAGDATFTGTLTSTGDFTVGVNKVTVDASNGNTSIAGALTIGDQLNDSDGDVVVADNIAPSADDIYSLGTDAARWSDVFVGPATIHIGSTTTGGDELAIAYNTNDNKALFNVGASDVMALTASGLTLNTGGSTDLTVSESGVERDNTLTIQGADGADPTKVSTLTMNQNIVLESSGGGVSLTANAGMTLTGATNNIRAQISNSEFSELDLTYQSAAISVNNGGGVTPLMQVAVDPAGSAIATITADETNIDGTVNVNNDIVVTGNATVNGTLTAAGTFQAANLDVTGATTLNGTVTLGNADGDVVTVNSTGGLTINSDGDTDLTIDETKVARANTLIVQGSDVVDATKWSTLTLGENAELLSSTGGVELTASSALNATGLTTTIRGQSSVTEYSEVNLSYDGVTLTVNNPIVGATSPQMSVSVSPMGDALANVTAGEFDIDVTNTNISGTANLNGTVNLGDASADIVTVNGAATFQTLTTFTKGMKVATAVVTGTGAAYVVDDDDFVVIQNEQQDVDFPAGANGRMLIIKNTSGADIHLIADGTEKFEGNQGTITLADAISNTFVFNGGVWYLIGN